MPTFIMNGGTWRQIAVSKQEYIVVGGAWRPLVNKWVLWGGQWHVIYVNGVDNELFLDAEGSLDDYSGFEVDLLNGRMRAYVDKDRRSWWKMFTFPRTGEQWPNAIAGYGQNNYWQRLYTSWAYFQGIHYPYINYASYINVAMIDAWGRSRKTITQPSAANGFIFTFDLKDPQNSSASNGMKFTLTYR